MNKPSIDSYVLDVILEIQSTKKETGRSPDFALETEIYNSLKIDILESLRSLYTKGLIEFHKTVNGTKMFGLKQQQ